MWTHTEGLKDVGVRSSDETKAALIAGVDESMNATKHVCQEIMEKGVRVNCAVSMPPEVGKDRCNTRALVKVPTHNPT